MPLTAMNTSRTWQNMYLKTWNTARTGNRAFTTNSLAMLPETRELHPRNRTIQQLHPSNMCVQASRTRRTEK